jgi:hypothetical protein
MHKKRITDIFGSIDFELVDPGFKLSKRLPFGDIVDNDCDPAVFVIDFGNGLVLLLPCSVPDLELDILVIEGMDFFKVDGSQGRFHELVELVVHIPDGKTALADPDTANDYDFGFSRCLLHDHF